MRKLTSLKLAVIFFLILTGGFFSAGGSFVYGQNGEDLNPEAIGNEIKDLNEGIQDKKSDIKKFQDKQKQYEQAIAQKQTEKASLNNQMAILDNRLAKAELDIVMVETEIERTKLEIKKTDIEITNRNEEIDREKGQIANILKLIYKRDNVSTLEILLLNDSLATFLNQAKYLEDMNDNVAVSLGNLQKLKNELEKDKLGLNQQNKNLGILKNDLLSKQNNLSSEKDNKIYIISQVNQSEKEYQRLLVQAKKEQEQAAADISNLEKVMRVKLAKLQGNKLEINDNGYIWPVANNTITSYFHDPDYPFKYIFEHPAIDIRAGQGTTIKAAASGYVARAKSGGEKGYGYIMLIHSDGLSTVYGHVSKIFVKEEDYIIQGQAIGLSGGLPGTPGAGSLTTGPHLHFEVRLNGIPVDPLGYLP
jgi:murein DD-endopeptidase MepM/ murein hydrolase activator NlpD